MNKKFLKRFLSVLLTLILCCTAGVTAFAAGEGIPEQSSAVEAVTTGASDIPSGEVIPSEASTEISVISDGNTSAEPAAEEGTGDPSDGSTLTEPSSEETTEELPNEDVTEESSAITEEQEESSGEEAVPEESTDFDEDAELAAMLQEIRDEYGEEAAASVEKMLNNENVKNFTAVMESKMQEQFGDMTEDEITAALESMKEEELIAWMDSFMEDQDVIDAFDKLANDEELAADMDILLGLLLGDMGFEDDADWDDTDWDDSFLEESGADSSQTSDGTGQADASKDTTAAGKDGDKATTAANTETAAETTANDSQQTPYTGDSVNPYIFLILMAAAVVCGGLVIYRVRKNKVE